MKTTRKLAVTAALALALAGCSSPLQQAPQDSPSDALSASASATPTPTKTVTSKPAKSVTATPTPEATTAPSAQDPTAEATPLTIDDGMTTSLAEFLNSGGVCGSDYFPAGPPSEAALVEIQTHCANVFPTDENGYQRPAEDANGYVGPSEEYARYEGYVEPGFEYQVGSECFDPALGRCKSSGEIQAEWMEQVGPPAPPSIPEDQGFGCFKDEQGNDYCVDPAPPIP